MGEWQAITEKQKADWTHRRDHGPWVRVRRGDVEMVARWVDGESYDLGDSGDVWVPAHWQNEDREELELDLDFVPKEWAPLTEAGRAALREREG